MNEKCSFCGRTRPEAFTFFRPPEKPQSGDAGTVFICDRCIESCHTALAAKRDYPIERAQKQRFREWLVESVNETLIRAIVDMEHREALLASFAERADLAEVDPSDPPQADALGSLPAAFLRENRILPWRIEDDCLVIAFYNPLHLLDIYEDIVRRAGMPIRPALLPRDELLAAVERYVGPSE